MKDFYNMASLKLWQYISSLLVAFTALLGVALVINIAYNMYGHISADVYGAVYLMVTCVGILFGYQILYFIVAELIEAFDLDSKTIFNVFHDEKPSYITAHRVFVGTLLYTVTLSYIAGIQPDWVAVGVLVISIDMVLDAAAGRFPLPESIKARIASFISAILPRKEMTPA